MNPPRVMAYSVSLLVILIVVLPILYMVASPIWLDPRKLLVFLTGLVDSRQIILITNSLTLAAGTVLGCLVIGVPYAFLCFRTNLAGRNVFLLASILPVLIPPYIHAIIWNHMNPFLEKYLSFDIHSIQGAILVLTFAYFSFVVLTTLTGLKGIDRNLEEASLLYQGKFQTLRKITFPLVMPHILSGAVFVFVFAIMDVSVPDFLRVKAYPLEIFIQFSAFYDEFAATVLSLPLVLATFFLIWLQKLYMKDRSYIQLSGGKKERIIFNLKGFQGVAFLFCAGVTGISTLLPVWILIDVAGPVGTYIKAFNSSVFQIGYSLNIAFWGSLSTLLLGFFLAYLVKRSGNKGIELMSWAGFLPFAIPATTIGIGLIGVWNHSYIDIVYSSSIIIIMGYISRFIPFAVIVFMSGINHLSRNVEEAAVLAGASFIGLIRTIVLPMLKQNVLAVFFIVFVLSLGELSTTLLIIPPGRETLPIKIYNLMHYGAEQEVAALCLILVGIIFSIAGFFLAGYRKAEGRIRM